MREGAILPFGKDIQNTKQSQADNIKLKIYSGKDGEFTIYEDEGVNYNYEKGQFAKIKINYDEKTKTVTIADIQGSYAEMPATRTFEIELITKDNKNQTPKIVEYSGKKLSVTM